MIVMSGVYNIGISTLLQQCIAATAQYRRALHWPVNEAMPSSYIVEAILGQYRQNTDNSALAVLSFYSNVSMMYYH